MFWVDCFVRMLRQQYNGQPLFLTRPSPDSRPNTHTHDTFDRHISQGREKRRRKRKRGRRRRRKRKRRRRRRKRKRKRSKVTAEAAVGIKLLPFAVGHPQDGMLE